MRPATPRTYVLALACGLVLPLAWAASARGEEGLAQSSVLAAMRPYMQAIRDCVNRQHELDKLVEGRLELAFTIGNRGKVTRVEVLTKEHARSYVAGCADGVIRSVKFPRFQGRPVVVPKFPVALGRQDESGFPPDEDDEEKPQAPKEARGNIRAQVQRRLRSAVPTIRACVRDHEEKPVPKKRRRRRKAKKPGVGPLSITLTLNPLGRATEVQIPGQAHRKDHVAGCVTGVLAFVEFPSLGSEPLRFSRLKLPRL